MSGAFNDSNIKIFFVQRCAVIKIGYFGGIQVHIWPAATCEPPIHKQFVAGLIGQLLLLFFIPVFALLLLRGHERALRGTHFIDKAETLGAVLGLRLRVENLINEAETGAHRFRGSCSRGVHIGRGTRAVREIGGDLGSVVHCTAIIIKPFVHLL